MQEIRVPLRYTLQDPKLGPVAKNVTPRPSIRLGIEPASLGLIIGTLRCLPVRTSSSQSVLCQSQNVLGSKHSKVITSSDQSHNVLRSKVKTSSVKNYSLIQRTNNVQNVLITMSNTCRNQDLIID